MRHIAQIKSLRFAILSNATPPRDTPNAPRQRGLCVSAASCAAKHHRHALGAPLQASRLATIIIVKTRPRERELERTGPEADHHPDG